MHDIRIPPRVGGGNQCVSRLWGKRDAVDQESNDPEYTFRVAAPCWLPFVVLSGCLLVPISFLYDLQRMMYEIQINPSLNNL